MPEAKTLLPGVAFQPRGFREIPSVSYPSRGDVLNDLRLLRAAGIRGLVTYGAAEVLGGVPSLARSAGFDGLVVMGIWDPFSEEEFKNAVSQASFVDGYCLGNEGLGVRYSASQAGSRMARLRELTGKPVTTSEPIARYLEGPDAVWLVKESDWLFPIALPALGLRSGGVEAVDWITVRYDYLAARNRKQIILKEAGFPTGGAAWTSEQVQADFFRELVRTRIPFYFFEAFDQPHKRPRGSDPEIEHHWGLFFSNGTPKKVAKLLATGAFAR